MQYKENQTVAQLIALLKQDPGLHHAFERGECIVMQNGRVIPPHRRGDVAVERNDEFSIFPIVEGG